MRAKGSPRPVAFWPSLVRVRKWAKKKEKSTGMSVALDSGHGPNKRVGWRNLSEQQTSSASVKNLFTNKSIFIDVGSGANTVVRDVLNANPALQGQRASACQGELEGSTSIFPSPAEDSSYVHRAMMSSMDGCVTCSALRERG